MRGAYIILLISLLTLLIGNTGICRSGFPTTPELISPPSTHILNQLAAAAFAGSVLTPWMIASLLFLAAAFLVRLMARK